MREPSELHTPEDVDALIAEIGRYDPDLRNRAVEHLHSHTNSTDPKLNAMCNALRRRAELEEEIRIGIRSAEGVLNAST